MRAKGRSSANRVLWHIMVDVVLYYLEEDYHCLRAWKVMMQFPIPSLIAYHFVNLADIKLVPFEV